jgi:hypothetical protein
MPTPLTALYDYINSQPLLKSFSNAAKNFLRTNGGGVIKAIQVCRTPLSNTIQALLNLITFGQFNEARKQLNMDRLFHLYMRISYNLNGANKQIILEKNQMPVFSFPNVRRGEENISVPVSGQLMLEDMCSNAIKKVGNNRYFVYNAFSNNCQQFINDNLNSSPQIATNANIQNFIMQDVTTLISKQPWYTAKVASFITNFANKASQVLPVVG